MVSPDVFWRPMASCPAGVKVQLLNPGGCACYGTAQPHDKRWIGWCPLPKRAPRVHIDDVSVVGSKVVPGLLAAPVDGIE